MMGEFAVVSVVSSFAIDIGDYPPMECHRSETTEW